MIVTGYTLCQLGMSVLSLSTKRHWKEAFPEAANVLHARPLVLKAIGFTSLALALLVLVAFKGVAQGAVYLAAWATMAALLQALLLSYQPQWVPWLIAAMVGLLAISLLWNIGLH